MPVQWFGRYTTKWWCHAVAGCWPVGSRTGAVFRRSSLAVAPRFLATQRDHKLRQHNLSVVSARDELRQTIAILGWQEHRWQKERLCNFGHLHHGGLQSGRVTCAMAILRQQSEQHRITKGGNRGKGGFLAAAKARSEVAENHMGTSAQPVTA